MRFKTQMVVVFLILFLIINGFTLKRTHAEEASTDYVFKILTDQIESSHIEQTGFTGEGFSIGFSRIPLKIDSGQDYFIIISITRMDLSKATLNFEVDMVPHSVAALDEEALEIPFGDSRCTPLVKVEREMSYQDNIILIPYAKLEDGDYWLRLGLNGYLFSMYNITVGEYQ